MGIRDIPLNRCDTIDDDNNKWYQYDDTGYNTSDDAFNRFVNRVGYITECQNPNDKNNCVRGKYGTEWKQVGYLKGQHCGFAEAFDCDYHTFVDQPNGWGPGRDKMDQQCLTGTDKKKGCGLGENHIVCQKNEKWFEMWKNDGTDENKHSWPQCCNTNKKNNAQKGCHPHFYKGSEECVKLCLGKSTIAAEKMQKAVPAWHADVNKLDILKNDPDNSTLTANDDVCANAIKDGISNYSEGKAELFNFCKSPAAFKNGKPTPQYTNICGCHYPRPYYDMELSKYKQKFPNIPQALWGRKECFSHLCQKSNIKDDPDFDPEACDRNIQLCMNNMKVTADTINLDNNSNMDVSNFFQCIQKIDSSSTSTNNNNVPTIINNNNTPTTINKGGSTTPTPSSNEVTLKSTKNKVKTFVSKNKVLVIIFLVVLIIVVGLIIYLSTK